MNARKLPPYSVLMSVYVKDDPKYLDVAIASMVDQTLPFNDLVIVCDGVLTDGLDAVLKDWQRKLDNRMTICRLSKNVGLGAALAVGLKECKCDVVARMDSDDISRRSRCELLLTKMAAEKLDLIGGAIEEFDCTPGDMGSVRLVPLTKEKIDSWLKRRNPFNHVSVMFDRRVVEKAGGYQPFPWMEDYWLWARMIAMGCRYANVSDVVVDVRTGDGMYARRSNWAYFRSQAKFFSEMKELRIINSSEKWIAIMLRLFATVLPTHVVKSCYNKLLRISL